MKKKFIFLGFLTCILIVILSLSFIKKDNRYFNNYKFTYNIDSIIQDETIFSSYIAANLEQNGVIKQELFNYSDILDDGNYINIYNKSVTETKKEVEDFFSVENDYFDNIKDETISYSYFIKNSSFAYQFDIIENFFGLNTSSESGLSSIVNINYYIDENNYSLSLIDNEGSELIYMHTGSLENKTYLDLYHEFLDKKCNTQEIVLFGKDANDSALFPIINVIIDTKIDDELSSNHYCGARLNISGTGNYLGADNLLDKNNIKYNFTKNSVLFIKRQDCQYPNLIIPCHQEK